MSEDREDAVIAWCCRHKWVLGYIAVVVTIELVIMILTIRGVL